VEVEEASGSLEDSVTFMPLQQPDARQSEFRSKIVVIVCLDLKAAKTRRLSEFLLVGVQNLNHCRHG
jgi:hypothetical protein